MADDKGGFFSSDHQTNEGIWDALGIVPGVGSVINGVNAAVDVGNVISPDEGTDRGQAMRDLAQDATSAIPLIGSALDIGRVGYDILASNDTSHDLVDRALGGPESQKAKDAAALDTQPSTGPQVCQ